MRIVAGGAIDLSIIRAQRQTRACCCLPFFDLPEDVGRRFYQVYPALSLRAKGHACRVRPHVVATAAGIVQVALHVERYADSSPAVRFGNTRVTQRAGIPRRIAGDTFVRIQLLVIRILMTLVAIVALMSGFPVAKKGGVRVPVGLARVQALHCQIMASRANDIPSLQRSRVTFGHANIANRDARHVAARSRVAAATVTAFARLLDLGLVK